MSVSLCWCVCLFACMPAPLCLSAFLFLSLGLQDKFALRCHRMVRLGFDCLRSFRFDSLSGLLLATCCLLLAGSIACLPFHCNSSNKKQTNKHTNKQTNFHMYFPDLPCKLLLAFSCLSVVCSVFYSTHLHSYPLFSH